MPEKDIFSSQAWLDELHKVVQDYHLFVHQNAPMEAKEFAAYHNACKAALAHILILKKFAQPPSQVTPASEMDLFDLLKQAQKATHDLGEENDSFE